MEERWNKLHQVVQERGADPAMRGVPGGKSGLMVHNVKSIGSGDNAERVDLYEVDTGLLQQCLNLEKQAAQECGQWSEDNKPATGPQVNLNVILPYEQLRQLPFEQLQRVHRETLGLPLED
jgi:hypothetical protein